MSGRPQRREGWADLLRCAAVLAVIVLHTAGSQLSNAPLGSAAWHVLNGYNSLSRWCVPAFIMLSGAFLLDPERELPLKRLFSRHILRIAAALLVWGAFYALLGYFANCGGAPTLSGTGAALYSALLGNTHYHLWFLYMVVGLYLVTPVLRAFVRGADRQAAGTFFLLAVLFACLLPTLLRLRPSQTVSTYISYLNVKLVLGHVGYFTAGYYLRTREISPKLRRWIYALGILGAAVTLFGTAGLSLARGTLVQTLYEYDSPNVAAMSLAVFVLFRGARERNALPCPAWAGQVAGISFGIYLVHETFLMLLRHSGITALSFFPLLSVPVLTALVFFCSLAAAWLISKLPVLGRCLT